MAGTRIASQNHGARPFLPPCRVCGDKAAGFHYGVNTCEACKGFFHRSLRKHKEYKCRANRTSGYCEYKPGKRKSCQFCRYQKCLRAGMSKEAIKTGRYTYLKRTEDTREIKRLLSSKHQTGPGSQDVTIATLFTSAAFVDSDLSEFSTSDSQAINFLELDSTTTSESDAHSVSEDDQGCSRIVSSICKSIWSTSSLFSENRQQTSPRNFNSSFDYRTPPQKNTLSAQEGLKPSTSFYSTYTKLHPSTSPDLDAAVYNNDSGLQNSKISDNENSNLTCQSLMAVLDGKKEFRSSAVYRLLRSAEVDTSKDDCRDIKTDISESCENREHAYFILESSKTSESISAKLAKSSSLCANQVFVNDTSASAFWNVKTPTGPNMNLTEPAFDLFPDISFCLDGQPTLSPASMPSDDLESPTTLESSDLLSSVSLSSPAGMSDSPESSPGLTMLNLDSGRQSKADNIQVTETDLCHTPETNYPLKDHNLVHSVEDNVTLQIMEEYTQGLDLIIECPSYADAQTPVQTLLTSPSPQGRSLSPELPLGPNAAYLREVSLPTRLKHRVKSMQPSEVEELYGDKDAVISMLMESHKANIGDYSHVTKEEMLAQQKAHYEACMLKKQTFGELGFLQDREYDEIYSVTGIDVDNRSVCGGVDNRRLVIQKYLSRMEKCVRGLVQFAKSIPGFSCLDMSMQVDLIKLARSEFAIFTMYPTVNMELGVTLGLAGEHWSCTYELGTADIQMAIAEYMSFSDKLQKMGPTQEEEVLLKAILVVSTDRDNSVNSPLAEVIRWQLLMCLLHSLEKNRQQPSLFLARYIMVLTQTRTVAEKVKDFLRHLQMRKYSSIEQNPLLWEMYSWILLDEDNENAKKSLSQLAGAEISHTGFLQCPVML